MDAEMARRMLIVTPCFIVCIFRIVRSCGICVEAIKRARQAQKRRFSNFFYEAFPIFSRVDPALALAILEANRSLRPVSLPLGFRNAPSEARRA